MTARLDPGPDVTLRPPKSSERETLNALIVRAKAVWGYDAAFMAAAKPELILHPADMGDHCRVAVRDNKPVGVAVVSVSLPEAEVEHLFVDPAEQGHGAGRRLFCWCAFAAQDAGAQRLWVLSDPNAERFYRRMGMAKHGEQRSPSTGRLLPRLIMPLPAQG